eukprot:5557246-Karenia_brevis.AAC.1
MELCVCNRRAPYINSLRGHNPTEAHCQQRRIPGHVRAILHDLKAFAHLGVYGRCMRDTPARSGSGDAAPHGHAENSPDSMGTYD